MRFEQAIKAVSAFVPEQFEQLKEHLRPEWIEEALSWTGTTSIRRRRLPADQVVWLVIGMGLFRNEPIERVVDLLDLAEPDGQGSVVAKSAITQARQRLKDEPRYVEALEELRPLVDQRDGHLPEFEQLWNEMTEVRRSVAGATW